MQCEFVYKIIVIGQASTGKTSFIKRYVHELYSNHYKATVGVDFALKSLQYDENTIVRLQLWDIAGQDRFETMTRACYRDAVGAFLVFDVSKPRYEQVIKWKTGLDEQVSLSDGSKIPCLLLANKCDLIKLNQQQKQQQQQQIIDEDERELREFAKKYGFIDYIYTSSKNNINIDTAARILIKEIMSKQEKLSRNDNNNNNNNEIADNEIINFNGQRTTIKVANSFNQRRRGGNNNGNSFLFKLKNPCCH